MERDFSRQTFLGRDSTGRIKEIVVGVAGLGGGGSHVIQQLAHIGVLNSIVVDDQLVENSNLNRLVGATADDAVHGTPKVDVAKRTMLGLNPVANVRTFKNKWQDVQTVLRGCSVLFGCVDSFVERDQLEQFARRFGIAYIDIGMDVHRISEGQYHISGQVILSTPGQRCLRCLGLITDETLSREARRYGDAGINPQVIWPNDVLASTAVGIFMQLLTPWHREHKPTQYLEYDGNTGTMVVSNRLLATESLVCQHFDSDDVGDPYFKLRKQDA